MEASLTFFRKWVQGKQTIGDIAKESGYSERQFLQDNAELCDEIDAKIRETLANSKD